MLDDLFFQRKKKLGIIKPLKTVLLQHITREDSKKQSQHLQREAKQNGRF